jgi:YbgC/YbaW family acyl-CoA thioester hydrolase
MSSAHYPIVIKEHHLDTFGHVNNATYLQLFEEARWEWITQNGYGLAKVRETGLGPTLLEVHLKFLKEVRLRQKITIQSRVLSYVKKISVLEQAMKNEAGEICCQASFTVGLFDTKERKLVLPTKEWLQAVGFTGTVQTD